MADILYLAAGFILGAVLVYFIFRRKDAEISALKNKIQLLDCSIRELKEQTEQKENLLSSLRKDLAETQQAKTASETRLEEAVKNIGEQKRLLERAEEKMAVTFQALSGESLKSNNRAFIELAKETLETVLSKAKGDLGKREESIKNIVNSLNQALGRYEKEVSELEKRRASDYGSLGNQIKQLTGASQKLERETGNLVNALRRPEVRGRWGEITLKRVVELSGMYKHCDFTEQVSISTDTGALRPDMIVHLPAGRDIVVDSKVSLDAFIDAVYTDNEEKKNTLLAKHAQQVRKHMKALSGKKYWEQFSKAPEFAVMFIPGEAFLSAAVSMDHTLIEDGMENNVIISTPTILIAVLRAVAFGWRQEQIAKHAKEIAALGKEVYDRFQPFVEHINKTGGYLSQTAASFNKMVMSLERRVMVSVRKFKELGAAGGEDIPDIQKVEQVPMRTQP